MTSEDKQPLAAQRAPEITKRRTSALPATEEIRHWLQLPDADVLPSNPSRWRDSSVESRAGWAFISYTRHSHPPVLKY